MRRRLMLASLVLMANASAMMQSPGRSVRLGWLVPNQDRATGDWLQLLLKSLNELGYAEGRNLTMLLPANRMAPTRFQEVLAMKPDILVTATLGELDALHRIEKNVPIVMTFVNDPVEAGLAASLARPGGNVTGASSGIGHELYSKRLELLRLALPGLKKVGVLLSDNPDHEAVRGAVQEYAKAAGLGVASATGRTPQEIHAAMESLAKQGAGAVIVLGGTQHATNRVEIGKAGLQSKLALIGPARAYTDAGFLMSLGPSPQQQFHLAARYIDKIAKGAKPGDLAIEQPTKFEMVVNRKTALALHLKLKDELLLQADEVIE